MRRMSAKSRHLLVRISPNVIIYHVIGADKYKKMLGASKARLCLDMRVKWSKQEEEEEEEDACADEREMRGSSRRAREIHGS